MSVLVTGSRGLLGTRFTSLFEDDLTIVHGDRKDGFDLLNYESMLSGLNLIPEKDDIDCIVHLAAFTDVSAAHLQDGDTTGDCYRLNVEGTRHAIRLANELGAHLIFCSTDFVFDGKVNRDLSEDDEPCPIEWYGKTKFLGEQLIEEEARSWSIIRIAFPFLKSPGVRPDLVQNILSGLKEGKKLRLFGDQLITPTFADDVALAIRRLIEKNPPSELFHVTGNQSYSPFQLGQLLSSHLGISDPDIEETSLVEYLKIDPRPRQQFLVMDNSKYLRFCEKNGFDLPRSVELVFPEKT